MNAKKIDYRDKDGFCTSNGVDEFLCANFSKASGTYQQCANIGLGCTCNAECTEEQRG